MVIIEVFIGKVVRLCRSFDSFIEISGIKTLQVMSYRSIRSE